ncbi:sensor histidine kinase [Chitinophaga qingshengii]|uniref:Histidine kinase n=1 Tax=Chitinophaga qingshengii TaxID=1569794 RepID=A0ABR7TPM4_9BACT|nr:sensor histidine kinase [Chitinophaga qingshengii]MBC9931935.1 histidine kinase [Chitinophaga qingshengii]
MSLPLLFIRGQYWYNHVLAVVLSVVLSGAIEVTCHRWRQSEQALHSKALKAAAELSALKSQLQPHFLFNTLNNIYSLAMLQHEHTAASILKLSNMMRYATTDTGHDYVLLQREIECIHDYIDLQQLRLTPRTRVKFSVSGNPGIKCIAPMLLLPFLEKAFQYGVSNQETSEIVVHLQATDRCIRFYCSNRQFPIHSDTNTATDIRYAQERLQQLYPQRHQLQIKEDNGVHVVKLSLDI